jgi:hypothetical protein
MIKLSKTGWNNVIIISVMSFILLINVTSKNIFSNDKVDNSEVTLLGEYAVILTLTINKQLVIERIGKTWRATPANINGQALEQMMLAWQQSIGASVHAPNDIDQQLALIVSVELAGQAEPTLLSIHATDQELLVFNHLTEQWLSMPMQLYSQLLPSAVFNG